MVNISSPKDTEPPTATGTAEILQQVLAQNQELMQLLSLKVRKVAGGTPVATPLLPPELSKDNIITQ